MFEPWHSFYQLLGSAAGALIGLLFVVVTLTVGRDHERVRHGVKVYMTPNLWHFSVVLLTSAAAQAPDLPLAAAAGILGAPAAFGILQAAYGLTAMKRRKDLNPPHWTDVWCYTVLPGTLYLVLLGAAVATPAEPVLAARIVAVVVTLLLFVAIRNAWDLVTWLAPKRGGSSE